MFEELSPFRVDPARIQFTTTEGSSAGGYGEVSRAILHPEIKTPFASAPGSCGCIGIHAAVAVKKLKGLDSLATSRLKRVRRPTLTPASYLTSTANFRDSSGRHTSGL